MWSFRKKVGERIEAREGGGRDKEKEKIKNCPSFHLLEVSPVSLVTGVKPPSKKRNDRICK